MNCQYVRQISFLPRMLLHRGLHICRRSVSEKSLGSASCRCHCRRFFPPHTQATTPAQQHILLSLGMSAPFYTELLRRPAWHSSTSRHTHNTLHCRFTMPHQHTSVDPLQTLRHHPWCISFHNIFYHLWRRPIEINCKFEMRL